MNRSNSKASIGTVLVLYIVYYSCMCGGGGGVWGVCVCVYKSSFGYYYLGNNKELPPYFETGYFIGPELTFRQS